MWTNEALRLNNESRTFSKLVEAEIIIAKNRGVDWYSQAGVEGEFMKSMAKPDKTASP